MRRPTCIYFYILSLWQSILRVIFDFLTSKFTCATLPYKTFLPCIILCCINYTVIIYGCYMLSIHKNLIKPFYSHKLLLCNIWRKEHKISMCSERHIHFLSGLYAMEITAKLLWFLINWCVVGWATGCDKTSYNLKIYKQNLGI